MFFIFLPLASSAEYLSQWVVIKVLDGDTIDIKKQEVRRIRLADIDAPEKKQSFGLQAKEFLSKKILGKTVSIKITFTDEYGRYIGTVFIKNENVNKMMVVKGAAWVYEKYNTDRSLPALQREAQEQKRGLWVDNTPTPPWEWRLDILPRLKAGEDVNR